ncbi:MAG: iron-containing alcohol dehydrogenase [Spirochaetota bacterium]|nr:iron-containing alcohol dehydrogenase [Spirochaetota bacterium]
MVKAVTRFSFPVPILYGPGSIGELPREFQILGVHKPLIVTDPMMEKTEAFKSILKVLDGEDVDYKVFSGVQPNPHDVDVENGVAVYKSAKCDFIIGVGGGSPMDAAKVLAVLVGEGGCIADYDVDAITKKEIQGPLPKIILIPTTAGTGSEVGKCSVISSSFQGRKIFVCDPLMAPTRAVLDPELTVSLPAHLTAATGMDALTHSIESLTAPSFHPMCDGIAVKGIEFVVKNLEKAVKDPSDIEARGYMLLAAMMGAVAFQKDLGAAHSLSHALSAVCNLQHGLANAIVLPYVMNYNKEVSKKEYTIIAREFGINIFGMDELEAAEKAIEEIRALNKRIGITFSLREVGVKEDQLDEIAGKAYLDHCHYTNSRSCTQNDLMSLLKEAY